MKRLDTLVLQGIYTNRTEAIRDQIKKGLAQIEAIVFPMKNSKYRRLLKRMLEEKKPLDVFHTTKSVVDLVSEGREK